MSYTSHIYGVHIFIGTPLKDRFFNSKQIQNLMHKNINRGLFIKLRAIFVSLSFHLEIVHNLINKLT